MPFTKITKKNQSFDIDEEDVVANDDLEIEIEENENIEKIFDMVKRLDSNYSDVLVLKLFYDMNDREIAESLNISVENVRTRIFRGRNKLKMLLGKENSL